MLEVFKDYFSSIEMPGVIQERADQLCTQFSSLIPGAVERVFVTDSYDAGSVRRYHSLWLVSGNIAMESKNFLTSDNIDFVNLAAGILYIEIYKSELENLQGPTTIKSNLVLNVTFSPSGVTETQTARLRAVHNNCSHLAELVERI